MDGGVHGEAHGGDVPALGAHAADVGENSFVPPAPLGADQERGAVADVVRPLREGEVQHGLRSLVGVAAGVARHARWELRPREANAQPPRRAGGRGAPAGITKAESQCDLVSLARGARRAYGANTARVAARPSAGGPHE